MKKEIKISEWLQLQPEPDEIQTNADGTQFIPIGIVERLLDDVTGQCWGTRNFKFERGFDCFEGSVELMVLTPNWSGQRIMVGAATLLVKDYPDNADHQATLLSECIKNAAKKLGNRFGRSLNGRLQVNRNGVKSGPVKMKPDMSILKEFESAIKENDTERLNQLMSIYQLALPE